MQRIANLFGLPVLILENGEAFAGLAALVLVYEKKASPDSYTHLLLFSHAFSDNELMEEEVYKAILFDRIGLNEGMFFENAAAQMLRLSLIHI